MEAAEAPRCRDERLSLYRNPCVTNSTLTALCSEGDIAVPPGHLPHLSQTYRICLQSWHTAAQRARRWRWVLCVKSRQFFVAMAMSSQSSFILGTAARHDVDG